jgi:hypothetical protein
MPTKDKQDFDDVNGGFEFEAVPTWEDVAEDKPGSQAEKSDFDTDFSNLDFGGGIETEATSDTDNGFGFNFDAMPTEQSVTSDHHRGDPSSEFEEFGVSQDEYSSKDTDFSLEEVGSPSSPEEASQFDEFDQAFAMGGDDIHQSSDNNSYYDDATEALTNGEYIGAADVDPYTQVQDSQPAQQAVQSGAASGQKSLASKLIMPLGIGAIVLVGGFVGYTSLFSSTAPAPAIVAQNPPITEPQFPSVLPPEQIVQVPETNTPSVSTDVALNPPLQEANQPTELTFDLPGDTSTDVSKIEPPVVDNLPTQPPVLATPEVAKPVVDATPVLTEVAQPVVDNNLPAAEDIALKSDLQDVLDRLASLEAKVDDLAESFSAKVTAPALPVQSSTVDVSTGSGLNANALPVASIDNIDPPLKPIVIEGLTLVGVSGDTAWINTGKDVISVKKSDTLPKGGKVEDIRQYRGDWVLVATDGIVLR